MESIRPAKYGDVNKHSKPANYKACSTARAARHLCDHASFGWTTIRSAWQCTVDEIESWAQGLPYSPVDAVPGDALYTRLERQGVSNAQTLARFCAVRQGPQAGEDDDRGGTTRGRSARGNTVTAPAKPRAGRGAPRAPISAHCPFAARLFSAEFIFSDRNAGVVKCSSQSHAPRSHARGTHWMSRRRRVVTAAQIYRRPPSAESPPILI